MEAIALFGYQLIREDTSMKSLALHLVCHEMMHTIASGVVDKKNMRHHHYGGNEEYACFKSRRLGRIRKKDQNFL